MLALPFTTRFYAGKYTLERDMGEARTYPVAADTICTACKSRAAVREYVVVMDGVRHEAEVCEDCFVLLSKPPQEPRRAS